MAGLVQGLFFNNLRILGNERSFIISLRLIPSKWDLI
jgi:hypothetical protein